MKKAISTEFAPKPLGPYSQGILSNSNRLYVSSQMALNVGKGTFPESIEEQTFQVLTNIQNILKHAKFGLSDVVKVVVYLPDQEHFQAFNRVYETFFDKPYPARSTIHSYLEEGQLIEMDVIAEK